MFLIEVPQKLNFKKKSNLDKKFLLTFTVGLLATNFSNQISAEESMRMESTVIYSDRAVTDPGANSILSSETISLVRADHPAEIINQAPGANIQMNSGQENLIALRSPVLTGGAGQGSFLLLENGVPIRASAFGNVNALFEIYHENADSIEVIRGPGSAKYGSNAVHGTINVIHGSLANGENHLTLSASSLDRYRADLDLNSVDHKRFALSVQSDQGWRDSTGFEQQKLLVSSALNLGDWMGEAWITASNLDQETGDFVQGPDAYLSKSTSEANDDPDAGREAWSIRSAARLSKTSGNRTLTFTPYILAQDMSFIQHFLPNRGFEENDHWSLGLLARYDFDLSDQTNFTVGHDFAYAEGGLKETQDEPFGFFPGDSRFPVGTHYDYDVETFNVALWAELEWQPSDNLTILAGLRGEVADYEYQTNTAAGTFGRFRVAENRGDSFTFVTPKLGLTWQPGGDDLTLFANLSRGARAPQASDLYRLQSQQEPGEAEAETIDSVEIGLRSSNFDDRLQFEIAAYSMRKDNFFFRDADGLNVTDGKTDHQGVETQAIFDLVPNRLNVSIRASWSDQTYAFNRPVGRGSEVIVDGAEIDTAPEWLAGGSISWLPIDQARITLSVEHIGEYYMNPANTFRYPGHTVGHLDMRYELDQGPVVFLRARNITDERYADRADFAFGNERYFPGEPLNVALGVDFKF